jgi:hypothetical protein
MKNEEIRMKKGKDNTICFLIYSSVSEGNEKGCITLFSN